MEQGPRTSSPKEVRTTSTQLWIMGSEGVEQPFLSEQLKRSITRTAGDCIESIDVEAVYEEAVKNIFPGISVAGLSNALILAATAFIERDPAYNVLAARFLFKKLFKEVLKNSLSHESMDQHYRASFINAIQLGVAHGIFDARLLSFDLPVLADALVVERDTLGYMGIKTLYERYLAKLDGNCIELLQSFWMRVAMGMALEEQNKTDSAIKFYNVISALYYIPSTPTLLHSGLARPQLSSCFLGTVLDDLSHIFKCIGDTAQLSKWSGGVAYDWTNVRATGALIKSINVESQGVIPFLKITNDTTAAINRSGKRRSAAVVYLETWHLDIEDFIDLKRNTGDERRRTHDINTAHWIPDLFMKRMLAGESWTLFSPQEVPDLHELYGRAFEERYQEYEKMAQLGQLRQHKTVDALQLWRKMLSRLFETGHPWITFKDACNIRSPQDHVGVVHCSNLCTEITLNTSATETAVCNLGSINLAKHIKSSQLDDERLRETIAVAIRMLDNVIDINFYPTAEAKNANLRHRPIGLGLMGLQDALYLLNIPFDSAEALEFSQRTQEKIAFHAILASSELARERGTYQTYKGSKWDRNIFPQDTITLLEKERGTLITTRPVERLDWAIAREHVRQWGMRNSNTMAIAPTATISNIAGCYPCIEPVYRNLYVKANMTGEFTVINQYLVEDLKKLGLWTNEIREQLKFYSGNVQEMAQIPKHLKRKYKDAFDHDQEHLVGMTGGRGHWIDQSQSHNVFMKGTSGEELSRIYIRGYHAGIKSFYYLRSQAATKVQASTYDESKFRSSLAQHGVITNSQNDVTQKTSCTILSDPDCSSCQ